MRAAHFVQRYPPALGGSEAYFARLSRHLAAAGDPDDPHDRTRRAYLQPALVAMLHAADRVFVQTEVERSALLERGFPAAKLVLQGMGVDVAECTGGDRARARAGWGVGPGEAV